MKTITKLFLVGLIALGMTACSNEDEIQVEGKAESTVSIKVVPSSNGPVVRSVGDLTSADTNGVIAAESAIESLQVYLFDDLQGGISAGSGSSTGSAEVTNIKTTSGPKTIIVIANCSIIGEITNKSQLLAKTKDLPAVIANGLPMTGIAENVIVKPGYNIYGNVLNPTISVTNGANQITNTNLPLTRINARVAIVAADMGDTNSHSSFFDGLTAVEVAMFNVPKTSELFGERLVTESPVYLHGDITWPTTEYSYTPGTVYADFFNNSIVFPITSAKAPYYYVNEHSPKAVYAPDAIPAVANDKMLIVLRGKPYKGTVDNLVHAEGLYTTAGYTYYPVKVNLDGEITGSNKDGKILRNTQYNISLTIKGIGNPTIDPPAESWLDVAVEVAPWLVITQDVEWNTPTL